MAENTMPISQNNLKCWFAIKHVAFLIENVKRHPPCFITYCSNQVKKDSNYKVLVTFIIW